MSWGAVVGAGVGLLGSAMSSDKNGGAGAQSQTSSKEPWAPAQPWLLRNLVQGQALQDQYTAQPFSPKQQAAYDNSYAQSDYMRQLVPSLLGQMGNQGVGFDANNPLAKPKAWDWTAGLGSGAPNLGPQSVGGAQATPSAAPPAQQGGDFMQQGYGDPQLEKYMQGGGDLLGNSVFIDPSQYTGKFGSFKYGDAMPQPGTQGYKDMNDYFAYGGQDPMNKYGKGPKSTAVERSGGV